ncbi:glycoside hydrolase 5 family protein [Methylobacterium sp. P31]
MRCIFLALILIFNITATIGYARTTPGDSFVRAQNTQFTLDGQPYYVTGANNHYLPWGSEAEISRVLDDAVAMGANVIRTFLQPVIGSLDNSSVPTIWRFQAEEADSWSLNVHGMYLLYWDSKTSAMAINSGPNGMQRIDRLLAEARKRNLKVIVAFLDFWGYTGGAQQMRSWYGSKDENTFFFKDPRVENDYKTWISFVINRVNSITGYRYKDDPTIFAWELMNEPQAPLPLRGQWISAISSYVKALDPNHLVGSGEDRLNADNFAIATVDFVTWHGYPKYYGVNVEQFNDLITSNCGLAGKFGKPVLLEEFGYARSFDEPTQARVYETWLSNMRNDRNCAGWLIWRLVSRQDQGHYPPDTYDQFDVHNDGGATWNVLLEAARLGRGVGPLRNK